MRVTLKYEYGGCHGCDTGASVVNRVNEISNRIGMGSLSLGHASNENLPISSPCQPRVPKWPAFSPKSFPTSLKSWLLLFLGTIVDYSRQVIKLTMFDSGG